MTDDDRRPWEHHTGLAPLPDTTGHVKPVLDLTGLPGWLWTIWRKGRLVSSGITDTCDEAFARIEKRS